MIPGLIQQATVVADRGIDGCGGLRASLRVLAHGLNGTVHNA